MDGYQIIVIRRVLNLYSRRTSSCRSTVTGVPTPLEAVHWYKPEWWRSTRSMVMEKPSLWRSGLPCKSHTNNSQTSRGITIMSIKLYSRISWDDRNVSTTTLHNLRYALSSFVLLVDIHVRIATVVISTVKYRKNPITKWTQGWKIKFIYYYYDKMYIEV